MSLRLAIVTDIHYGPDTGNVRGPEAIGLLEQFHLQASALGPDLMVELGDRITDQDEARDLDNLRLVAEVLKRFHCPREHLLGNHDVIPRLEQERLLETRLDTRALELRGWNLVFLDTFNHTIGGVVARNTLNWLENHLARTSLPTIIFSHQPLHGEPMIGNQYFETDYADHACPSGSDQVRRILERSPHVRLCVSGHAHWNDLRHVGNLTYLTLQSLTESWATDGIASGAWTWLELDDTIRVQVHGRAPLTLEISPNAVHH